MYTYIHGLPKAAKLDNADASSAESDSLTRVDLLSTTSLVGETFGVYLAYRIKASFLLASLPPRVSHSWLDFREPDKALLHFLGSQGPELFNRWGRHALAP